MEIRPAHHEDLGPIGNLVDSNWQQDSLWGPSRSDAYAVDGQASIILAVDGEVVLGVGSFLPSSRSAFGVLHVDVAPGSQRQGVGSALLARLRREHPETPMMVRARPWDDKTVGFMRHHSFEVAERVIEGWLDPTTPEMEGWIEATQAGLPEAITIEQFDSSHPQRHEIAAVLDAWYERHHPWAPPRRLSLDEAIGTYLDPALAGTCHFATVAGHVVGAGVLLPDPFRQSKDGAHLAYLGVGESDRPDELQVVHGLLAACLASAKDQRRPVQIEVSNHHRQMCQLVQSLPASDLYEGLFIFVG